MGAICLNRNIAYHLFSVDTYCPNDRESVKLTRKSKWHSQYGNEESKFGSLLNNFTNTNFLIITIILCLENAICGLDFNPLGTLTASFDHSGVCLISDVDTNDYSFHLKMGSIFGNLLNYLFSFYFRKLSPFLYKLMTIISLIIIFTIIV